MTTATLAARVAKLEKTVAMLMEQRASAAPPAPRKTRKLKALSRPPLQGLPADLSENTRQKVRAMILSRHAADR